MTKNQTVYVVVEIDAESEIGITDIDTTPFSNYDKAIRYVGSFTNGCYEKTSDDEWVYRDCGCNVVIIDLQEREIDYIGNES